MNEIVNTFNQEFEVHSAETSPSIYKLQKDFVCVRLFGTFEVENHQGRFCESNFKENQSLALLQYLMAHPDRKLCLSELIENNIWYLNRLGGKMDNAVALRVRRAKAMLNPLGLSKINGGLIISENGMYHLNPNYTIWRDVDEFDRLMNQIELCALDDPDGLQLCLKALELYRGQFLERNKAVPWIMQFRSYYHQRFLSVVDSTLARMKQMQQFEALPLLCSRTASIIPEVEGFHMNLIQLLMDLKEKKLLLRHLYELAEWKAGQEN